MEVRTVSCASTTFFEPFRCEGAWRGYQLGCFHRISGRNPTVASPSSFTRCERIYDQLTTCAGREGAGLEAATDFLGHFPREGFHQGVDPFHQGVDF